MRFSGKQTGIQNSMSKLPFHTLEELSIIEKPVNYQNKTILNITAIKAKAFGMLYYNHTKRKDNVLLVYPKVIRQVPQFGIVPVSQMGETSVSSTGFVSLSDSSTAQRKMKLNSMRIQTTNTPEPQVLAFPSILFR